MIGAVAYAGHMAEAEDQIRAYCGAVRNVPYSKPIILEFPAPSRLRINFARSRRL